MRVQPFEPSSLIGAVDPVEGTTLVAGETVWFCRDAKVGYHSSTITYLVQANGGRCVACRRSHEFEQITLPLVARRPITWRRDTLHPPATVTTAARGATTTWVGSLDRTVRDVKPSPTGAYLIEFDPVSAPSADFRLVILPPSVPEWTRFGIDIATYRGRRVRVRGRVHDHPWWRRVMVVTQPSEITFLDASARTSIRWQPPDSAPERQDS
jgi:hypothetical protein